MKKIFFTIMAAMLANLLPLHAAELKGTVTINGESVPAVYRQLSSNTVALGNGHNTCVSHYVEGFLSVPGSVQINGNQYTVTEVSDLAFRLCEGITGVEFEEGVTRVGAFAFIGCPAITEITLPESMQSLGSGAFQSCLNSLKSVTCKGTIPPKWEYNDVFVFHEKGIGDNAAGVITAATKLFVPNEATYQAANFSNPSLGWTTPDGWGSFSYIHVGQATFHIDSPFKLQVLHEIVNVGHMYGQIGAVYLDADIDMSNYPWDCGMGISEEEAFEGSFYGNGHTISNLTIDTENYGGFFAHYGGHYFSDVTFKNCTFKCDRADLTQYPNGTLGCVVGECGALTMRNVCLDNCEIVSDFKTNGFLMGRCLTSGGADFFNCVVKDCRFLFSQSPSYNGFLVGECFGGSATDCGIYNNEHHTMSGWMPFPFVAKCAANYDFYVTRCYNTRQMFSRDPNTDLAISSNDYQPAENVKYSQVVLDKNRTVNYINSDGNQATADFSMSIWDPIKNAYFRTLFMIPELGLQHWIYQEGEYPVPAEMAHLLPAPQANRASYCPLELQSENPRINSLSPEWYIPNEDWYDMTPNGYLSYSYVASRLWINDNFSPNKPESMPLSIHNPMLPIGTAKITATNGIEYNRTLDVTHNGTASYTVPIAVLDGQGNPIQDEDGFIITDGEMSLYEYNVYKATDYTLYLPYSLNVNGGASIYEPVGTRQDDDHVVVEMRVVDDGIIKPWFPYYIMVNDAPIKLGVDHEIVIEPREKGILYQSFTDDNYRMYGSPGKFTPGADITPYRLQEDDTWRVDQSTIPPFTCYLINQSGETVDHFNAIIQLPLSDSGENEDRIAAYNGTVVDVVLDGRTFYKDDTWYTLCLPFDVESFHGTPLDQATVRYLSGSEYNDEDGTLRLHFMYASSIEAGRPYIIKWNQAPRIDDPIFESVSIKSVQPEIKRAGPVAFAGTYSPVMLPEGNKQVLYIGDDNQLFYPESPTQINAFRGFFMLSNTIVNSTLGVTRVVIDYDSNILTPVEDLNVNQNTDPNWYTIDGRVLRDKPTAAGIYIHNGKKILIK